MPVTAQSRLVYLLLAAHLEALVRHLTAETLFQRLWIFVEKLPPLIEALAPAHDNLSLAGQLDTALDEISFMQAQLMDADRQNAECSIRALRRMAAVSPDDPVSLSPQALLSYYVSEAQRQCHHAVVARITAQQTIADLP